MFYTKTVLVLVKAEFEKFTKRLKIVVFFDDEEKSIGMTNSVII